MLNHITIRNFAIVDELSLDLQPAMSVLTGETGAGKSILLDALNLALGDRADSGNIRHDAERAEISVLFTVDDNSPAHQWLTEQALDQDNECLIRRVINREGRSKGFINGSPVPMQSLKDIGEMLVDIHGQHEHQSLLKRDIQRQLLDDYADNQAILQAIKNMHREWQQKYDALALLKKSANDRQSRLELLQYQVEELEKLELQDTELRELPEEQARLANAEKLRSTVQSSLYELYDAEQSSTHQSLSQITRSLEALLDYDPKLKNIVAMLENAAIQIQEASADLRTYVENIELDPERLAWIEERIGVIHELSRKHHIAPEALPDLHNELAAELDNLSNADQNLETLEQELQALEQQYHTLAKQLGDKRSKAAKKLDKSVTDTIRELGMPSISFTIQLIRSEEENISIHGNEKIEFMISPNPGQPQKPLRKIASGGELSRISLAIQTVLADSTHIPTLIYDEVDSGIGGPTAEVVGKKLRSLGDKRQVLCVTHLAQVASQAHHHLLVSKQVSKNTTTSRVQKLDQTQRVDETARMLGGIEITEQSLLHAREMIERGQLVKKKQVKKSRKSA
jgi:DNA repair protein RecN (Recombination protein N)